MVLSSYVRLTLVQCFLEVRVKVSFRAADSYVQVIVCQVVLIYLVLKNMKHLSRLSSALRKIYDARQREHSKLKTFGAGEVRWN